MRRLLIRLIAVESMLVGWLAYWLFLVYANNPSVGQGLVSQLGRFPQLSFTTVDISVLVIIATLSIFLAFKFQRGLRPGIRLERALQMLENLMKRNLVLEAQVAELKMEKAHMVPSPTLAGPVEPKVGSWERAFKTPIEAGPALSHVPSHSLSLRASPLEHETRFNRGMPRVESRAPLQHEAHSQAPSSQASAAERAADRPGPEVEKSSEKGSEKPFEPITSSGHSAWEDSPKHVSETGVLTPSPMPKSPASMISVSTSKQPYIPVPVPKTSVPSNVIIGPGAPTGSPHASQPRPSLRNLVPAQASPRSLSSQADRPLQSTAGRRPSPMVPLPAGFASPRSSPALSPPVSESKPDDSDEKEASKDGEKDNTKLELKPGTKPLKRFPYEEE